MWSSHANTIVRRCRIIRNTTLGDGNSHGGGLFGDMNIDDCLIAQNTATGSGGGVMFFLANLGARATNCTIVGNRADNDGGGIACLNNSTAVVSNCVVWSNEATNGVSIKVGDGGNLTVSYSDVEGGELGAYVVEDGLLNWGVGNISDRPSFANPADEDYRLMGSSPGVDAGDNFAVPPDVVVDLDGNPRFLDEPCMPDTGKGAPPIVDMGAYEFVSAFVDCNQNGNSDICDIVAGTSADCNSNGVPDECDIARGASPDCNNNGVPDECDIAAGTSGDCNTNGVPDECDIRDGTSLDENGNGIPDECEWLEDFDIYDAGSQMHGQGGWKGFDNNPAAGALVAADESHSPPHSVSIQDQSNLLHEFSGADQRRWVFRAWQFVPSTHSGESKFVLLNTYQDGGPKSRSVRLKFNGQTGMVTSVNLDGETALPILVTDAWAEIRIEIDLATDTQSIFYDNQHIITKSWTDGLTGGGELNIAAVQLRAGNTTQVYYDDLSLLPVAACDPCDMDCDGDVNAFDIEPFLELLFDPNPKPCNACTGDTNGDGAVDAFDIEPFLECLFP